MINVPYTKQQIDWLFQNSDSWAIAFAQFEGQINNVFPVGPLLQFAQLYYFIFPKVITNLKNAMLIFTDCSSNGRAVYVLMVKDM